MCDASDGVSRRLRLIGCLQPTVRTADAAGRGVVAGSAVDINPRTTSSRALSRPTPRRRAGNNPATGSPDRPETANTNHRRLSSRSGRGCVPCGRRPQAGWSSRVSTAHATELRAALIGRIDRRGRLLWSLPKGHIESGETAEQTAMREVAEETGIQGRVLAALGSIDYWFVTEGRRVHKTVHHYLMRSIGGELSDADVEVTEVAWVPLHELQSRLAYADERRLAVIADSLIDRMDRMETAPVSGADE